MLISVQSTNPENYNTVRINFDIPWKCEYVKYYVSSINTMANILMTTDKDELVYFARKQGNWIGYTYSFVNCGAYPVDWLADHLSSNSNSNMRWEYDEDLRVYKISALNDIYITEPPHRVKLILGLYNTEFPIEITTGDTYIIRDVPILRHTKMYLLSLQGNPMYSNIGEQQHTPSVIGNIDTITIDGQPFIYNFEKEGKPLKIKTYTESLKYLEISLVDFQFQPIMLRSPLFVCVKIKPAKNADVKDVLTK